MYKLISDLGWPFIHGHKIYGINSYSQELLVILPIMLYFNLAILLHMYRSTIDLMS